MLENSLECSESKFQISLFARYSPKAAAGHIHFQQASTDFLVEDAYILLSIFKSTKNAFILTVIKKFTYELTNRGV
jgi:hypothetical protein